MDVIVSFILVLLLIAVIFLARIGNELTEILNELKLIRSHLDWK